MTKSFITQVFWPHSLNYRPCTVCNSIIRKPPYWMFHHRNTSDTSEPYLHILLYTMTALKHSPNHMHCSYCVTIHKKYHFELCTVCNSIVVKPPYLMLHYRNMSRTSEPYLHSCSLCILEAFSQKYILYHWVLSTHLIITMTQ